MSDRVVGLPRTLACALMLCVLVVPATAHAADTPSTATWVTDGPVRAMTFDGTGRAYVGGEFEFVGPRLGSGLAFATDSNAPVSPFPEVNGPVRAAVADGSGGVFIGGEFTAVGGLVRQRLAHIRADGTVDPTWDPGAKATVRALALSSSGASLYVGGDFAGTAAIGGQFRERLALVSTSGVGAVDPDWRPFASGSVRALVLSGTHLYVGGLFSVIDGPTQSGGSLLARLNPAGTGEPDPAWVPNPVGGGPVVNALALSGPDHLFVGGRFGTIGGQTRNNLAKVAVAGAGAADATWAANTVDEIRTLLVAGPDLFVGGTLFDVEGQPRRGLAKVSIAGAGVVDPTWNPNPAGDVNALALAGTELVVGGDFLEAALQEKPFLMVVPMTGAGAPGAWLPNPNGPVHALAPFGTGPTPPIFAGGEFSSAGPLNEFRGSLIRLKADGSLDKDWNPLVDNGGVLALALDGENIFIGGTFFRVRGQTRAQIAKVSTAGVGEPDATWNPGASGEVRALAVSGTDLFAGGDFFGPASIGGVERRRLAKLATTGSGAVDPVWTPTADSAVNALAHSGGELFVGGDFFDVTGSARDGIAKLSPTGTGAVDPTWNPTLTGTVNALLVSGSSVYAGGTVAGRIRKVSAIGAGENDAAWSATANAPVSALALAGGSLYVGGEFSIIGGQSRSRVARVAPATGAVDPGFNPPPGVAGAAVYAIAASATRVLVGGSFNGFGPLATANLALFDLSSPTATVTTPVEGARYRAGQTVAAAYTCADPDGGTDVTCTGPVASGTAIDTATPGTKTFTVQARDAGGNLSETTVGYTVDGSAPAVAITTPQHEAEYVVGTRVKVAFSCTDPDGPSDVAACSGTAPNGSPLDTTTPGNYAFTVTSADAVGNTETLTVNYSVAAIPVTTPPVVTPPVVTPPVVTPPVVKAPVISRLSLSPTAFRSARRGATTSTQVGTRVSYRLSAAGAVTFTIRKRSGKKVGAFTLRGKVGKNAFTFRGRVNGKRLRVGRYRMVVRAKGTTGLRSARVTKAFRIVRR